MKTSPLFHLVTAATLFINASGVFAAAPSAPKADVITFASPKATYVAGGAGTVKLGAAAASKAGISYVSSNTNVLTVDNVTGMGTLKSAGTVNVTASTTSVPAGYTKAPNVTTSITIAQAAAPKLTAIASNAKPTYAPNGTLTITPTSLPGDYRNSSPVTYSSSATNLATVNSSGVVTLNGAGKPTITVTFPSSPNYVTPKEVAVALTIAPGSATITPVGSISSRSFVPNQTISINKPTSLSTGAFTYTTASKNVTINGSTITVTGASTNPVVILAAQVADANYEKTKTPVQIASFMVNKATDSVTKPSIARNPAPGASVTLPSVNSTAGLPVVYTLQSGTGATVSSGKVTPTVKGGGTVSVKGATAGNDNYNATAPFYYTIDWGYNAVTKVYSYSAQ
jgi:hypothetical protein